MNERLLTMRDAAQALNVSPQTIRNWNRAGHIRLVTLPGGHHRVPETEVQRLTLPFSDPLPAEEA